PRRDDGSPWGARCRRMRQQPWFFPSYRAPPPLVSRVLQSARGGNKSRENRCGKGGVSWGRRKPRPNSHTKSGPGGGQLFDGSRLYPVEDASPFPRGTVQRTSLRQEAELSDPSRLPSRKISPGVVSFHRWPVLFRGRRCGEERWPGSPPHDRVCSSASAT